MPDVPDAHRRAAAHDAVARSAACGILTVSDTRTMETDASGRLIESLLLEAGHRVAARAIVPDEPERVRGQLEPWLDDPGVTAIVTTGGTGLARRDTTVNAVRGLLSTEIEGFGELFRSISFAEIGPAAMLSRAIGGLVTRTTGGDTFLFALPGSTNAVETALRRLILPELPHLIALRRA